MGSNSLNAMELDAIGEIMNISLGASATAVSTMLGTMVNITTPVAEVLTSDEFSFERLEPAVGVDISYVQGLEGSNVMIFRRNDIRIIVGILMGAEIPEEEFELDELNISAICEVMNQMMGSSATALSEFLGYPVDISTPKSFEITDGTEFRTRYFPEGSERVVVRFTLVIEGILQSDFMNIMTIDLTKKLLAPYQDVLDSAAAAGQEADAPKPAAEPAPEAAEDSGGGMLSQAEIEALMAGQTEPEAASQPAAEPTQETAEDSGGGMLSQAEIEALMAGQTEPEAASQPAAAEQPAAAASQPAPTVQQATPPVAPQPMAAQPVYQAAMDPMMMQLMSQMQQSQMQMMEMMRQMQEDRAMLGTRQQQAQQQQAQAPRPNTVIHPVNAPQFADSTGIGEEEAANQELLMKVPLDISVEIGRTKKLVKDILEFTQGSLVVLDKMAGERADVFVNGECIARGDIVVVEDNFGIRITEIVSRNLNPESL